MNINEKDEHNNIINIGNENFYEIGTKQNDKLEKEKDKIQKIITKIGNIKCIEGNIDFLLPDITREELLNIINNTKISPFIFYDNLDLDNKNFDILGEIKQKIDTDDERVIIQLSKYIEMILLFKESKNLNDYFRLNINSKILMYCCNSS